MVPWMQGWLEALTASYFRQTKESQQAVLFSSGLMAGNYRYDKKHAVFYNSRTMSNDLVQGKPQAV